MSHSSQPTLQHFHSFINFMPSGPPGAVETPLQFGFAGPHGPTNRATPATLANFPGFGPGATLYPTSLTAPLATPHVPQPRFRSKVVCKLSCRYCSTPVCNRGMKAILLADSGVELFSTDSPPSTVGLIGEDYMTEKCHCRIRDVACLSCGNQVGYHVTQPCKSCLDACNNGHFWMFHLDHVRYFDRTDESGTKPLLWAYLPTADKDVDVSKYSYDQVFR